MQSRIITELANVEAILDQLPDDHPDTEQHRLRLRHLRLQRALTQLEEGTFGCCSECGAAIPENRLLEDPTIRDCAMCKA